MTTILVNAAKLAEALKIVIPFAGTDDMLPSLHAVKFIAKQGTLTLAASNRYVLGEYKFNSDYAPEIWDDLEFLLPVAAAKEWLKFAKAEARQKRATPAVVAVEISDEGDKATLRAMISREETSAVTEQSLWINNYERLFPTEYGERGEIGFTASVVGVLTKAFGRNEVLRFRFGPFDGYKPVTVTSGVEEFRGLIMPVRLDNDG